MVTPFSVVVTVEFVVVVSVVVIISWVVRMAIRVLVERIALREVSLLSHLFDL